MTNACTDVLVLMLASQHRVPMESLVWQSWACLADFGAVGIHLYFPLSQNTRTVQRWADDPGLAEVTSCINMYLFLQQKQHFWLGRTREKNNLYSPCGELSLALAMTGAGRRNRRVCTPWPCCSVPRPHLSLWVRAAWLKSALLPSPHKNTNLNWLYPRCWLGMTSAVPSLPATARESIAWHGTWGVLGIAWAHALALFSLGGKMGSITPTCLTFAEENVTSCCAGHFYNCRVGLISSNWSCLDSI